MNRHKLRQSLKEETPTKKENVPEVKEVKPEEVKEEVKQGPKKSYRGRGRVTTETPKENETKEISTTKNNNNNENITKINEKNNINEQTETNTSKHTSYRRRKKNENVQENDTTKREEKTENKPVEEESEIKTDSNVKNNNQDINKEDNNKNKLKQRTKPKEEEEKQKEQLKHTIGGTSNVKINDLDETINSVEKNNAKFLLKGRLAEIYEEVVKENTDFKNNIFFKNLNFVENKVGDMDKVLISHTYKDSNKEDLYKNIKTSKEIYNKYVEKASRIFLDN